MNPSIRRGLISASIVLVAALTALLSTRLSFIDLLERFATDLRLAAFQAPTPQSDEIVVVAITEETLRRFNYRSPIDRQFLSELLLRIDSMGVRAIGLDILLDQATEPAKDQALAATLGGLRTPLYISYTRSPEIVDERQRAFLDAYVPPRLRASSDFLRDPVDGAVRWINPGGSTETDPPSLARSLAALVGRDMPSEPIEIAWRARPDRDTRPFAVYPAHLLAELPTDWLRGRVVLIGGIVSLEDRHQTPLWFSRIDEDKRMPGILIHAHSLAQLIEGRTVPTRNLWLTLTMAFGMAVLGTLIARLRVGVIASLVIAVAAVGVVWVSALLGYRWGLPLVPLVTPTLAMMLALWLTDVVTGRAERKRRRFLHHAFSRYVSPAVVSELIRRPERLKVACERRDASFIFTDIADFTRLAEHTTPELLSGLLNQYLDGCCDIILRHQGTIDKFIGDGVMAVFNAPLAQPDHRERALQCGIEIDAWSEQFRAETDQRLGVTLGVTRIGIHSGPAMIGNFGSHNRMDFTALGSTVNIAARVESANRFFGTRLLCTDAVAQANGSMPLIPVGEVLLWGRTDTVLLHTPASAEQVRSGFHAAWQAARHQLAQADAAGVLQTLRELQARFPEEPLVHFHRARIEAGQAWRVIAIDAK
jgi:class 3 adenylate cyclase/CHASE2 domain-containing sensor protein